ncbi:MAG: VWA domain-containing protein, partial [Gammaproteobacteria bacterium]|nr:VWA domain-containing protein [Gammaproteobacteria bacterium]
MADNILHISWENFHFLRPLFLWLLLPAFAVLLIGLSGLSEQVKWKKFITPHLRPYVIQKGSEGKMKWMQSGLFIFLSIVIVGAAGPTWKKIEVPGKTLETPLVIALDLSQSMMATDIQPNRLERAKFKITDLLAANPRARVALVGFAGTAHTIVPLTSDYKIIKSHLDGLSPQMMPYPGTNLEAALVLVDTIIRVTTAPATLLLITDDFTDEIFNLLQRFVNQGETKVEIMPMSTATGANVPSPGSNKLMRNKQGNIVHSALDNSILDKLSSIEKIHINTLTLDKSDMELLAKSISSNLEFKEKDEEKEDDWQDKGLWFAIPFALFILMWFRKGWVIYSLLIMVGLSSCNSNSTFKNLWFTRDYQAQQLYEQGDFEQAADLYSDPLRKGVAYYRAGDYKQAVNGFEQDTTAMGAYNLGLAYYKNGDYAAAGLAFGKAVEMNPDLGDARANQTLMQQMAIGTDEVNPEEAEEAAAEQTDQNIENKDMEDLGGGGQEATKEDMEKERKEETANTDIRKGKELDEVPDNFESGKQDESQKILMRKVDDDPALFLKRKFAHQVK